MNRVRTLSRPSATSKPDRFPRRAARLVLTGPAQLTSPLSRLAVTLLAVAGAALLVWSGVIHLQLWFDGYRDISVIGPLFLIQGITSIALALALIVFRRLVLLAAGAVLLAATAVGAAAQRWHRPVRLPGKPGGAVRRDVPGRGVHRRGSAHGCCGDGPGRLARKPALARAILLSSPAV